MKLRSKSNLLIALGLGLLVTACDDTQKIEVSAKPETFKILQPAPPKPVTLNNITFKVVTSANLDEFVKEQKAKGKSDNVVFVAISVSDYENLSLNLEELARYIKDQKAIIVYYEKMTTPVETKANPK